MKNVVFHKTLSAALLLLLLTSLRLSAQRQDIIFQDSLANDDYKKLWEKVERCCTNSVKLMDAKKSGTGRSAVKFQVSRSEPMVNNGYRAELRMPKEKSMHIDRWYRFSIFLPKGYPIDSVHEIVAQWHETPDFSAGEKFRTAPISLQIVKDYWRLNVYSAKDPVNTDNTISMKKLFEMGKFKTGEWTTWLFHIKYSYKDDGILQVWKNNEKVVDYAGPNYYNDKMGPFFKIGLYKVPWKYETPNKSVVKTRAIFYSDILIGNEKATFKSMNDTPKKGK